jgi:hypothetical protein
MDVAQVYQNNQLAVGIGPDPLRGQRPWISLRNDTGAPLPRYAVVGLEAPLIDPADNLNGFLATIAFSAIAPNSDLHGLRIAITQEPIPTDGIGKAIVSGISPARVTITDESHGYAAVATGTVDTLESAEAGTMRLLWKAPGTGVQWALVLFPVGGSGGSAGWTPRIIEVLGGQELVDGSTPLGPGIIRRDTLIPDEDWRDAGVMRDPGSQARVGMVTRPGGVITAVVVSDGGAAYKDAAEMTEAEKNCPVTGGGGSGAVVHIGSVVDGVITSFTVIAGGTGYLTAPSITVPLPTGAPAGLPWPPGVGYGNLYEPGAPTRRVLIGHDPSGPIPFGLPANTTITVAGQYAAAPGAFVPLFLH